jgi:hypothetical protein
MDALVVPGMPALSRTDGCDIQKVYGNRRAN